MAPTSRKVICFTRSIRATFRPRWIKRRRRRNATRAALDYAHSNLDRGSTLAKSGDVFLDISVKEEACPLGLAPTASTTVTLAMGDALAVVLLVSRGFKAEDFAMFHPGGTLGRRLLLKVEDIMHEGDALPLVASDTLMREALFISDVGHRF